MSIKNHNTDYTFYLTERTPLIYTYPLSPEYCVGLQEENNRNINAGYTTFGDDQLTTEQRTRFLYNSCMLTRDELEPITDADGMIVLGAAMSHSGPYGWMGMGVEPNDPNRARVYISDSTLMLYRSILYDIQSLSQGILWYFKPDSDSEWQLLSQGDEGINIIRELASSSYPSCGLSNIIGGRFGVQMVSQYAYHLEQFMAPAFLRQSLVYMPRLAKDYPAAGQGFMEDDKFLEGEELGMTDYMASSITPFFVFCPLQLSLKQDLEIQMLIDPQQDGNVAHGVSVYLETGYHADSVIDNLGNVINSAYAIWPPFGPQIVSLYKAGLPTGSTQADVPALTAEFRAELFSTGSVYTSTSYTIVRGPLNQALLRFNFPVVNPDRYYAIVSDSCVPIPNNNFLRTSRVGDLQLINVTNYGIYNYTPLDIFAPIQYISPQFDPDIDIVEKQWLLDDPRAPNAYFVYGDYFFSIESMLSPTIIFSRTTARGLKEAVTVDDQQMMGSPVPLTYSDSLGFTTEMLRRTYRVRLLPGLWDIDIYPQFPSGNSEALRQSPIMIPSVSPISVTVSVRNDTTGSSSFADRLPPGECLFNQIIPNGEIQLFITGPITYETFAIENVENYPPYVKQSIQNTYRIDYLASEDDGSSFHPLSIDGTIIKDVDNILHLPECLLLVGIMDSARNVPNLVTILENEVQLVDSAIWNHDYRARGSIPVHILEQPIFPPPPPPDPPPPDEACADILGPGFPGWPGLSPKIPCIPLDPDDPESTAIIYILVVPQDVIYTIQKTNDTRPARQFKDNLLLVRVSAGEYTITGYPPDIDSKKLSNDTQTFTIIKDQKKTVSLKFLKCPSIDVPYLS